MELRPFLLDRWLNEYHFADPPVEFDLASSTGPQWTLRELYSLIDEDEQQRLLDTKLVYAHAAGAAALRESIANVAGVEVEDIQVVTGAAEALVILFFLAAEPGANVILPFPGYPPAAELPRSLGIEVRAYHLRRENGFRIDPGEIMELADRQTRLIMVNSPHNPTGSILSDDELRLLHDFAAERGIQFVVDEVYHPIYHDGETMSASRLPHATVLGDMSKAMCLSGLRVGWIIDRDPARRDRYFDARTYFTISNTPLGEALASIALNRRETILARAREITGKNLALLDQFMESHRETIEWVRPRGGMTAFPWLAREQDSRPFCRQLAAGGVLFAPGDCFGAPQHFRLGFGASGTRFEAALERLETFLETYSPAAKD